MQHTISQHIAKRYFYRVAIAVLLCLTGVTARAQGRQSMAKALETTPDAYIQKDYTSIGKVEGVHISVEGITDLTHNKKMNALEMEYTFADNSVTVSVLLDAGDADSLISYMDFVTSTVFKSPEPTDVREFSFTSRSNFEAGCYWNKGWSVYIRIDRDNSRTNVEFNREDVMQFQSLLKQAKLNL